MTYSRADYYADAVKMRDALEADVSAASDAFKAFPKGPTGLTPDEVKFSPGYRAAKAAYDRAFSMLRAFNRTFTRDFATELRKAAR